VTLRRATAADLSSARAVVLAERLNPLGLDASRSLAAADARTGAWLGGGQLSPLRRAPWQQQRQQQPGRPLQQPGQPQSQPPAFELRSLVVSPDARGRGVGTALVRALLAEAGRADVFLTTTAGRAPFYARAGGFEEEAAAAAWREVPPLLALEVAVGALVAGLVARQGLVVMRRRAGEGSDGGGSD